jgi:von Willebrand factor A domain-containing protein 8
LGGLSTSHSSFRILASASPAGFGSLRDWLGAEHASLFFTLPLVPMSMAEEKSLLVAAGADQSLASVLVTFATKYRQSLEEEKTQRRRKLGTRALVRAAKYFAISTANLHALLCRALLTEFLPQTERMLIEGLLDDCNIKPRATPVCSAFSFLLVASDCFTVSFPSGGTRRFTRLFCSYYCEHQRRGRPRSDYNDSTFRSFP